MKVLFTSTVALFCLYSASAHAAAPIAIINRNERVVVDASVIEKQAFVTHVATASETLDQELPLINPPEWGKTISAATRGTVAFKQSFAAAFFSRITLDGLVPRHRYLLALNGRPDLKGNDLLPSSVDGHAEEHFYDFLDIESDAAGHFDATVAVSLKPGAYHVRLYVKDTDDWKIVLYQDYFEFTVD